MLRTTEIDRPDTAAAAKSPGRRRRTALVGAIDRCPFGRRAGQPGSRPAYADAGQAAAGDQELIDDVRAALVTDRGFCRPCRSAGSGTARSASPDWAPMRAARCRPRRRSSRWARSPRRSPVCCWPTPWNAARWPWRTGSRAPAGTAGYAGRPGDAGAAGHPHVPDCQAAAAASRNNLLALAGNENPYDVSVEQLIDPPDQPSSRIQDVRLLQPRHVPARTRRGPRGRRDRLADARHERLLRPLGMTSTTFALTADDLPADGQSARIWRTAGGRPTGTAPAYRPGRILDLLDRSGHDPLRPGRPRRHGAGPGGTGARARGHRPWRDRAGLADHEVEGRVITWHNGGTGGMRTMLAIDRERGQAVIVLGNSLGAVDDLGRLLGGGDGPPPAVDRAGTAGHPGAGRRRCRVAVLDHLRSGRRCAASDRLAAGQRDALRRRRAC